MNYYYYIIIIVMIIFMIFTFLGLFKDYLK